MRIRGEFRLSATARGRLWNLIAFDRVELSAQLADDSESSEPSVLVSEAESLRPGPSHPAFSFGSGYTRPFFAGQ